MPFPHIEEHYDYWVRIDCYNELMYVEVLTLTDQMCVELLSSPTFITLPTIVGYCSLCQSSIAQANIVIVLLFSVKGTYHYTTAFLLLH